MNPLQAHNLNISYLSETYRPLKPLERIRRFYTEFRREDVLVTSSFGTSSAILLHHIARVEPAQTVHFIDTTYLFEETIAYKDKLQHATGLNIETVRPEKWKNEFTNRDRTWGKDPDLCCSVNKVEPLSRVRKDHKFWMSGLMAFQTPFREGLSIFEKDGNIIKFNPLIDVEPYFVRGYFTRHGLPKHPLVERGFASVGCRHCTEQGEGRKGRWANSGKTECGLHYRK